MQRPFNNSLSAPVHSPAPVVHDEKDEKDELLDDMVQVMETQQAPNLEIIMNAPVESELAHIRQTMTPPPNDLLPLPSDNWNGYFTMSQLNTIQLLKQFLAAFNSVCFEYKKCLNHVYKDKQSLKHIIATETKQLKLVTDSHFEKSVKKEEWTDFDEDYYRDSVDALAITESGPFVRI